MRLSKLMWDHQLDHHFKSGILTLLSQQDKYVRCKCNSLGHEASMIKNIKENLGVDIRGHTLVSQKPRTSHFDQAPSHPNF